MRGVLLRDMMKTRYPLLAAMAVVLVMQGCRTAPSFPSADLTRYEQRAREAIASMPIMKNLIEPMPKHTPHYRAIRDQNLRIAGAPNNFDVYFSTHEGHTFVTFTFNDPKGFYPQRYVEFDMSTGEMLECAEPIYTGPGGGMKWVTEGLPRLDVPGAEQDDSGD